MILANGNVYDTSCQDELLDSLEEQLNRTLAEQSLSPELVIAAIDRLGRRLDRGEFDSLLSQVELADRYLAQIRPHLTREALEYKLRVELGTDTAPFVTRPPEELSPITVRPAPLGVLLHIAAGNVDGLPAYSVVEGLLTGNINILKLPQADNGLSVEILRQLIREEPALADFIYAFDTPSEDVDALLRMAQLSDGVVVWGGDGAVSAVRLRRGGAASPFAVEDMETYHDVMRGRLRGGNTARIISAEGLRIVHLGDLGCPLTAEQTERISGCDALLIPVGGILTIEPYAAYELVRAARPKLVIPMHYNVGGGSRRLRRVEEFTSLFAPDEVEYMDESRLTLTSEDAPRPLVAVLAPPWGER